MKPEIYLRVVLEVEENSVSSPPRLPLSDDNGGHDLLPELGLTLLDGAIEKENEGLLLADNPFDKFCCSSLSDSRHDHVTGSGGGKPVQSGSTSDNGNDVDVLGTRVVSAVHNRSDGEGQRHAVLGSGGGGYEEE